MIEHYIIGALWGITVSLGATLSSRMFAGPDKVRIEPYWFWNILFIGCCALLGGLS